MNLIDAPLQTLRAHFALWAEAIASLFLLGKMGVSALVQGEGAIPERLKAVLAEPEAQRAGFAVLRAFQPNLTLKKTLVTAYESQGTAIVTRATDVYEVLDREADFAVVYEPKMRKITAGENFFLGMQNTAQYQHDVSLMRLAMRRDDVEALVVPLAREKAEAFAAAAQKRIDLPHDLTRRVPAAIVSDYLGVAGVPETDLIDWATLMFWYLFVDIVGLPEVETRALAAAKACRAGVDAAIAARKQSRAKKTDVLGRCLELQAGRSGVRRRRDSRQSDRTAHRRDPDDRQSVLPGRRPASRSARGPGGRARRGAEGRHGAARRLCLRGAAFQSVQSGDLSPRQPRRDDRQLDAASTTHPQGHDGAGVEPLG